MDKDIFDDIKAGMEDILAYTKGDKTRAQVTYVLKDVDVKTVRKKTGLTQVQFSEIYFIPLSTLKNWERGSRSLDASSRAYLTAIGNNPKEIQAALQQES
ncbi:MAG: hypothetical protein KAJ86_07395 [Alphaproteobacteria bacterium]|nr:hypothetical protein [Alphaproteobacteria bacterium]